MNGLAIDPSAGPSITLAELINHMVFAAYTCFVVGDGLLGNLLMARSMRIRQPSCRLALPRDRGDSSAVIISTESFRVNERGLHTIRIFNVVRQQEVEMIVVNVFSELF